MLGIFKDVRFYPILNFGHFWAPLFSRCFYPIMNFGHFGGGGGGTTENKDKREQNNIVRVCENVAGRPATFSQKHCLCPFRCFGFEVFFGF